MPDKVIDMAWSDIQVGYFVRWATPRFIKYGHVKKVNGRSLIVGFLDSMKPTTIPDAKWYFVQGKENPEAEEHLVVIDYRQWWNGDHEVFVPHESGSELIGVNQAAELIQMHPKQIRRWIRRGVIRAKKNSNEHWMIDRDYFMELAAKHGWI